MLLSIWINQLNVSDKQLTLVTSNSLNVAGQAKGVLSQQYIVVHNHCIVQQYKITVAWKLTLPAPS